jgi:SPP1 family predicted phage head-tail adaptor
MCDTITLLAPSNPDNSGAEQDSTAFATSYASVRALSGRELAKAQQIAQQVSHMVTIPYLSGVKEAMLVGFDSRVFRIQAIEDPDERKVELRMLCLETGQNAGEPGS